MAKSGAFGGARHITKIDWRSKGMSDADEEVAAILLQLPRLISDSNSFFVWGGKKKRQLRNRRRYGVIKKDPATPVAVPAATSTEEPSTSKQFESASSPDTPLISSFSPAATNSKLLPKRKSVKRKRENELLLVNQLEKERDLLRSKIENMRQQKDRAMAINTVLKRHQELIGDNHHHQEKEKDAKLGEVNTSLTLGMQWQWTQPPSIVLSSSSSTSSAAATVKRHGGLSTMVQKGPLIGNPTVVVGDNSRGFLSVKLGVGPQKLIDLNLPADGCHVLGNPQPLDPHVEKKVMATLARQKRCAIYKAGRRNLVKGIRY